jgi:hypothetical protein
MTVMEATNLPHGEVLAAARRASNHGHACPQRLLKHPSRLGASRLAPQDEGLGCGRRISEGLHDG